MLMILELARGLVNYTSIVRDGRWSRGEAAPLGFDLAGKVLGIVGYGRIGRAVADRARAFGMRILTYDVKPEETDAERCVSLDALLGEADIVSLHVDLSASTARLIGERELRLMKPTAYLVNTARGGVVDQTALVAALRSGMIAGAALDVLEREPPAIDDPILALPNALILPHAASATRETRRAMRELAVRNLLSVLRRDPPECCVNPESLARALRPS
jgi:glyoxylate reductase